MLCDGVEVLLGTHRRHVSGLVWGGGKGGPKGFPEKGASI